MYLKKSLNTAELMVLNSIRHWVGAMLAPSDSDEVWRHGKILQGLFCQIGGKPAAVAFDQFLGHLATHAIRILEVSVPCANRLSEDEVRLLTILGALQGGDLSAAEEGLRDIFCDGSLARGMVIGRRFCAHLLDAGLRLRLDLPECLQSFSDPAGDTGVFGLESASPFATIH